MKHRYSRRFLVLLTVGIAALTCNAAATAKVAAQAPFDHAAIDSFVAEQMAMHGIPGLSLAITRGNEVLYTQGYGSAAKGEVMTPQTQLFIASITKSFTALAVMQLVESGKIDLDAPVQHYLPEFTISDPAVAEKITIRHLLNHTSGLADTSYPGGWLPWPETTAEMIASLRRVNAVAAPGTAFHYFNPNYQLLAHVVEVASGEPFSAYLQRHIFTLLQMDHTFNAMTAEEAYAQATDLASGHIQVYGFPVAVEEMSGYLGGSSGIISTAEDMAHYLIMQNNGGRFAGETLLSSTSMETMHTPPSTPESTYAMGWIEVNRDGRRILEHNGVLSGFYADIALIPGTGEGVILLYNLSSLASNSLAAPGIKNGIISLLMGEEPAGGGFSVRLFGGIIAFFTLLAATLGIRALIRLPRWRDRAATLPLWRLLLGFVGVFTPALLLLGFPFLILATAGRAFTYAQHFRAMPGIFLWMIVGTVMGIINGVARIMLLLRGDPNVKPGTVTRGV